MSSDLGYGQPIYKVIDQSLAIPSSLETALLIGKMKVQFAFNREHGKTGIKSHNPAE
jgi:hypothetical protein